MNPVSDPLREKIEKVLEELRPMLKADGGNILLVGLDPDGSIEVHLEGFCADCGGPMMAIREGLSKLIREQVPEVREVRAV